MPFPDQLGAGRFLTIGLPMPELLGPFVGTFEIVGGGLVLLGLLTRLAAIPLLVIMAVALATTKWPILVDQGFWSRGVHQQVPLRSHHDEVAGTDAAGNQRPAQRETARDPHG
ncbi:MAG TPA: DoxX family protein [Vicinamibacterales bacterium]|nr:DoxX family protein [Vicinamibacterales bacterium]